MRIHDGLNMSAGMDNTDKQIWDIDTSEVSLKVDAWAMEALMMNRRQDQNTKRCLTWECFRIDFARVAKETSPR